MECHCLPLSELPHTTKLFRIFFEAPERVAEFFAHPPTEAGLLRAASTVQHDPERSCGVAAILREQNRSFGADGATEAALDRLETGAVAVVTGQQVGLFSGPAYSIYKALTALETAAQLTNGGIPAVTIFWLASEDHDLAEVNQTYWLSRGGLARLELPAPERSAVSVGRVRLNESVREIVRAATRALEGPMAEEVAAALEESYRPEETFGTAFGRLFARLFGGKGIILLDPLDSRLHRLAAPLYSRAVAESADLTRELLARNAKLDKAGYHAQVKVTERSTLLFLDVAGERVPLRRRQGGFVAGEVELAADELRAIAEKSPERLSANVLLRPVVQDFLLPTAAYVGGAAEVAYFAQAEVVYRRLLGRMPAVLPRAGFTIVEPQVARLLKKYGLNAQDVFRGRQHLRARLERQFLTTNLAKQFREGDKRLCAVLKGLRQPVGKLDRTLLGALDTAERKMLYQFEHLREKVGRAHGLRTGVLDAHERLLVDELYPHHGLQERTLNFLPFLARHGALLLDQLRSRSSPAAGHHVIQL